MTPESLLRALPVSVNNLADPAILRESTAAKLDTLAADGHTGPVALITKGDLSTPWWSERLPGWAARLDLHIFASISHLPREIEPAPTEGRYRTLRAARDAGATAISYIRPIMAGKNDSPAVMTEMIERSAAAGAHAIVSSGFRGDAATVAASGMGSTEAPDGQHWSRTLKIKSEAAEAHFQAETARVGLPYWTRTLCAVQGLKGQGRALNPYFIADKFVGCSRCPIRSSCQGSSEWMGALPGSLELLRYLGFRVEAHTPAARYSRCEVERRQQCSLCCTNCPVAPRNLGAPYVNLRTHAGEVPTWGEMSFARFLTGGMLVTDPEIPPGEDSRVRLHPRFQAPDGLAGHGGLYGVNSWMAWSEYLPANKCLRCSYCFLGMFADILPPEKRVTVGTSPVRVLQWE